MNRPLPSIAAPVALAVVAGLGLWDAIAARPILVGIGAAAVAGIAGGLLAGARSGRAALRVAGALVIGLGGLIGTTLDPGIVARVGSTLATFLSVDLPAAGLDDLPVISYLLVAPAVAVATVAARRGHTLVALGAPTLTLVGAALLTAPVGVPRWVTAAYAVVVGLGLLVAARERYIGMEPLVGTSTAIRRQLPWWRTAAIGIPAVILGMVALAMPRPGAYDVRRLVEADTVVVADENPLAIAARLRRDPPTSAQGTDVVVRVEGESPGRLRLAVLDRYEPEGWRQQAEFAVTGEVLEPGPLDAASAGAGAGQAAASVVTVDQGDASTGLRAAPTAGTPIESADPDGLRYSSAAAIFLPTDDGARIVYRSVPRVDAAPPGAASAPVGVPVELYRCPASTLVDDVAATLTRDTAAPLERLARIDAWLKLTKIYDPQAPGGQTVGGVERFVSQELGRGNLEVFVTAYALLARCADVPVRVVVGYPAPAGDARTDYRPTDVSAWVETPLAGVGWVPLDPVPTPEEQQRQAELARQPTDDRPDRAPEPGAPLIEVEPTGVDTETSWLVAAGVVAGLVALAVAATVMVTAVMRQRSVARRRRLKDPALAVRFAWRTLVEHLRDAGLPLGAHLTAHEAARATVGRVTPPVTRLMSQLADPVDRARYDPDSVRAEHAGLAWALADEAMARVPVPWRASVRPVLHPGRTIRRLRATRAMPRRRERWTAAIPASALVTGDEGIELDVPGYEIESRVGTGSTSTVYRGREATSGRAVAIKVFSFDLSAKSFDHQRFAWEARVAQLVSGQPNLPEVLTSGVTTNGQPYLVSQLYERATLLRRVQRGGALSPGEVLSAGRQLAMALETLHQNSILHGDVKPENVFIADDGALVLGDLGSAWLRADGGPAASMTPPYAAPEVWLGHAPTVASDIYSLGLTLMFAASARMPMAGSPPREDDIVEAFGSDVVLPLLEIDPRRRPRTALAAARVLGAEVEEYALAGTAALSLPTPTFTHRR